MRNLDVASQSCYVIVGKSEEKNGWATVLCSVVLGRPRLELRKARWQLAWRRSPRCSPARRSLRVWGRTCCSRWCNFGIMFAFTNYVSCFVGHHTNVERNRSLPLLDGVPQGLNSGKVSKVTEVEFWREPLCFKARHCCLLKTKFRIWKTKDYFWKYDIFLDLATSLISGGKVDVPLELFAQSSHLAAARMDSGIWIKHRWILGIIVLEIVTTPIDIRYTNMKKEMLTTPSPIPLLPPVTIATGIFRSGKWASF